MLVMFVPFADTENSVALPPSPLLFPLPSLRHAIGAEGFLSPTIVLFTVVLFAGRPSTSPLFRSINENHALAIDMLVF